MEFFDEILSIIDESDLELKFSKFALFYENFKANKELDFKRKTPLKPLEKPCYEKFCNVVAMRDLNKKIAPKDKNIHFIHSVAHIEFSAIDIALDAAYRFDGLPRAYYEDWLEVASDEIRHFLMISEILAKNGVKYGDFTVHNGLFIALTKTQNSLIERMALLPRYMEANGLDANAHIIKKLKEQGGNDELILVLEVILREEISHVSKGDRWFKFACEREKIEPSEYINIVRNLYPNSFSSIRTLNESDRLKAGFSQNELEEIKNLARIS